MFIDHLQSKFWREIIVWTLKFYFEIMNWKALNLELNWIIFIVFGLLIGYFPNLSSFSIRFYFES